MPSLKITTPLGIWFVQKSTGAMATLLDTTGADWIAHRRHRAAGEGEYRGFPNTDAFHPGRVHTQKIDRIVDKSDYVRIDVSANQGADKVAYEFFPTHCRLTFLKVSQQPYWCLFEGVPNGALRRMDTYWMGADGIKHYPEQHLDGDLADPEWFCMGMRDLGRVLLMVNHQPDTLADKFVSWADGTMLIAAFGRTKSNRLLQGENRRFSIGIVESDNPDSINAAASRWLALRRKQ
jgi:hypothetical protein